MRVRAIKDYFDLQLNKAIKINDEFEVTAARGQELTTSNNKAGYALCEELITTTPEKVEVAAPKSRKKKEA